MQKESLIFIKARTADPSWLCIFCYVKLRVYKHLLKIKLWGICTSVTSLMSILSLFLPLTPSRFQTDPLKDRGSIHPLFCPGVEDPCKRETKVGQPPLFKWAPAAYGNRASVLSGDFISYLCKPRNISLFLSFNFLMVLLPPSITLSI